MSCKRVGTKNGLGHYNIVIECGYDINGDRIRIRRQFYGCKKDAELFEAELKKEFYHKGDRVKLNDLTFNEYTTLFINNYCVPNISKITLKDYQTMLKRILPIIGELKLKKINGRILDMMYKKIKVGVKGKELSPKSMTHYYNLIGLMFKQAKKWKLVDYNPNEDATKPKVVKSKRKFYDTEQVLQLLEHLEHEEIKVKTLILLALNTGARKGEICALRWSDVDFEKKNLYIDNSLKVINGVVDEEKAKTDYSVRFVELGDNILEQLKQYKEWQDKYISQMGNKWQGTDRIFTALNGNHMHPDTPNKILQKVLLKYELPKISFHELRHTYASIMNYNGIDAKTISEQLGHSNVNISLNVYTHTFESKKRESAKVFDNLQNQKCA